MSQFNYDQKPKNDFEYEKPKNQERERGGCLSAFLAVFIVLNVLGFLFVCSQANRLSQYASGSLMPALALSFIVECGVVACAVAIWNWKKWGYYGLMTLYGISIVLNLCSGSILSVVGGAIIMAIAFGLINDKIELFD